MFRLIPNSALDYLTRAPWYECYLLSLMPDGTWGQYTKFDLIVKTIFSLDGRREAYWNGKLVGDGTYKLTPTTLNLGLDYKIVKLDADSFIFIEPGTTPTGAIKIFYSHVEN